MKLFHGKKVGGSSSIATAVIFVLLSASGCETIEPARTPLEMAPVPEAKLILKQGDVIDVKFFYNPELNENQAIRPDGKISLQLIGEVMAMGKTPGELRDQLVKLYTPQLRQPEVTVIVRSLANQRVFVGGFVRNPGVIELRSQMTALEAIIQTGGFDLWRAEKRNVVIIRHKDNKRYGCALDFTDSLKGKEAQPFYLEPQDIVFVPRNKISQINLWIDQHINQIIPRTGFTFSIPVGDATIGISPITTVVTQP